MAEFCLDCWNKMNEMKDPPCGYILSRELDLCEGCGEYKRVIVVERLWSRIEKSFVETTRLSKKRDQ